jgi:hypothetical protein
LVPVPVRGRHRPTRPVSPCPLVPVTCSILYMRPLPLIVQYVSFMRHYAALLGAHLCTRSLPSPCFFFLSSLSSSVSLSQCLSQSVSCMCSAPLSCSHLLHWYLELGPARTSEGTAIAGAWDLVKFAKFLKISKIFSWSSLLQLHLRSTQVQGASLLEPYSISAVSLYALGGPSGLLCDCNPLSGSCTSPHCLWEAFWTLLQEALPSWTTAVKALTLTRA